MTVSKIFSSAPLHLCTSPLLILSTFGPLHSSTYNHHSTSIQLHYSFIVVHINRCNMVVHILIDLGLLSCYLTHDDVLQLRSVSREICKYVCMLLLQLFSFLSNYIFSYPHSIVMGVHCYISLFTVPPPLLIFFYN